eukprot:1156612-Pelagomonas_calceolata.AAC.5
MDNPFQRWILNVLQNPLGWNSLLLKKVLDADISLSSRTDSYWTSSHLLSARDGLAHTDLMRYQIMAYLLTVLDLLAIEGLELQSFGFHLALFLIAGPVFFLCLPCFSQSDYVGGSCGLRTKVAPFPYLVWVVSFSILSTKAGQSTAADHRQSLWTTRN